MSENPNILLDPDSKPWSSKPEAEAYAKEKKLGGDFKVDKYLEGFAIFNVAALMAAVASSVCASTEWPASAATCAVVAMPAAWSWVIVLFARTSASCAVSVSPLMTTLPLSTVEVMPTAPVVAPAPTFTPGAPPAVCNAACWL